MHGDVWVSAVRSVKVIKICYCLPLNTSLFFFSLPYFLLLAPFSSAYDNGQEEERNIVFKHRERNIAGMKKTALPVEVV